MEITDLNRLYLERNKLHVSLLGRGIAWLDTGSHAALLEAANFVHAVKLRQGLLIACLEEIALRKGWINQTQCEKLIEQLGRSTYADYLRNIISER